MTKSEMFTEAHKLAAADLAWTKANWASNVKPYAHYFRLALLNLYGTPACVSPIVSAKEAAKGGIWA